VAPTLAPAPFTPTPTLVQTAGPVTPTPAPVKPTLPTPVPIVPTAAPVVAWTPVFSDYFEAGFTIFASGGADANIYTFSNGNKCLELRDDKSTSNAFTKKSYSVLAYNQVRIRFSYYVIDVDPNESFFLDWSSDNGSTWSVAATFTHSIDFQNKIWKQAQITRALGGFATLKLRFRSSFSDATERVFIDGVVLEGRNVVL
jgi:hypothetical protein